MNKFSSSVRSGALVLLLRALPSLAALPAVLGGVAFAQSAAPTYTFVDLGAPLGQSVPSLAALSVGRGLNDSRVVVGDNGFGGSYGAFQGSIPWRHPAGASAALFPSGVAMAVNNSDVVVGARWLNATTVEAVRVVNGAVEPLVSTPGLSAIAHAVSDAGHAIGEVSNETTFRTQAFRWFQGATTLIGAADGYTQAYGVNDAGDVVGGSIKAGDSDGTAFLWRNGTLTYLTSTHSRANAINNAGTIVGLGLNATGGSTAFRYSNGTLTSLGRLANFTYHEANAINEAGVIVGEAYGEDRPSVAVIWIGDQARDLNTLVTLPAGWVLGSATAINESGDIVGTGQFGSQQRAFLLQAATGPAAEPANPGRIINASVLAPVATAGDSLLLGFVVGGGESAAAKPLVIRAAGPALAAFGVSGMLDDPRVEVFAGASKTGENDNWGGTSALGGAMADVGAFPWANAGSKDAAIALNASPGANSVRVSAAGSGTGTVLAEIYDASANFTTATPRLMNVSVLKNLGSGLTVGFVIGGSTSRTVLIRAVGPTLSGAPYNVGDVAADPQLALYSGATKVGENNDWGGTAALTAAFAQAGAFALPAGSKDAALTATLAPGSHTLQVSIASGATGVAIVSLYELP